MTDPAASPLLLEAALDALAARRPVFHSEADFQHALAWQVQQANPAAAIRLEKRVAVRPSVVLDLLIELGGARLGVELKYLRRAMSVEVDGEAFESSTAPMITAATSRSPTWPASSIFAVKA